MRLKILTIAILSSIFQSCSDCTKFEALPMSEKMHLVNALKSDSKRQLIIDLVLEGNFKEAEAILKQDTTLIDETVINYSIFHYPVIKSDGDQFYSRDEYDMYISFLIKNAKTLDYYIDYEGVMIKPVFYLKNEIGVSNSDLLVAEKKSGVSPVIIKN